MKSPISPIIASFILAIFTVSTATVQAEDYLYETNNGTITITGYIGPGGDVAIPSTINGMPVTTIGSWVFSGCTNVTSVTIPDSVTRLSDWAFSGDNLTSVTIGRGVTDIVYSAFFYCPNLCAINVNALNPAFSSLDGVLFDRSQATLLQCPEGKTGSYTIPTGVNSIRFWGFYSCANLTSINIPDSVTSVEHWAFQRCTSLTNVSIGNGVTNIGEQAFCFSTNLTAINVGFFNPAFSSLEGVLFDKSRIALIQCPEGKAGAYTIPNNVTSIGRFAFYGCSALTNVTIPDTLTSIGYEAFCSCTKLTAVYFQGDAPAFDSGWYGYSPFISSDCVTVYYLPGTTGWADTYAERPTSPWLLPYPVVLTTTPNFGIQTNAFGFRISWATNVPVVVEASMILSNPVWSPVRTNTLTDGWCYFSDAEWTNFPARFYRIRQW